MSCAIRLERSEGSYSLTQPFLGNQFYVSKLLSTFRIKDKFQKAVQDAPGSHSCTSSFKNGADTPTPFSEEEEGGQDVLSRRCAPSPRARRSPCAVYRRLTAASWWPAEAPCCPEETGWGPKGSSHANCGKTRPPVLCSWEQSGESKADAVSLRQ